jgi:hypothetical protein
MPTNRHARIPLTLVAFLLLAAGAGTQTSAAGGSSPSTPPVVTVTMGARMTFAGPTRWAPGAIRIAAISQRGEQELTLLRFHTGYGYSRFLTDGARANGHGPTAAAALRRLFANTDFLGGANVFAGEPASFTVTLRAGTYYLGEMSAKPIFRRIKVQGVPAAAAPKPSGAVATTYDFGFHVNTPSLPAHGTITIRNTGRQIHRLLFVPVKAGTSRAQIGAYLHTTGGRPDGPQPPFARTGPQVGTAMISPGRQIQFSYTLPAGTYALLCFQPDTRTGKPQALEGMYGIATLR